MIYVDNPSGGQDTIYGVLTDFKINWAVSTYRRRRTTNVIQLGKTKPEMSTVFAPFTAAMDGTRVGVGEFKYVSPSKLLTMENVSTCSGIGGYQLEGEDAYAIPVMIIQREEAFLTNVYGDPEDIL